MRFPILQAEIMRGEKRSERTYDLSLYNPAAGKCDLSEEEARKKESRNRAESEWPILGGTNFQVCENPRGRVIERNGDVSAPG